MTTPKPYQLETEMNGALAMACQKAAPYVTAARALSTRRLYARAWRAGPHGARSCTPNRCRRRRRPSPPTSPSSRGRQIGIDRQERARCHPAFSSRGGHPLDRSPSRHCQRDGGHRAHREPAHPARRRARARGPARASSLASTGRICAPCATARSCSLPSSVRCGVQSSSPSTWLGKCQGAHARLSRSGPRASSST